MPASWSAASRHADGLLTELPLRLVAPVETASSAAQPSYAGAADTYAVVELGGHQLIVEEGRWYTVNRLEVCGRYRRRNSNLLKNYAA